ncbi:Heparinase II/III family protein [Methylocella silvestris BL2]|uniref:Heparinase II/III family protein n=1 Tax=Methylocella silvestris (strain DSM 15510 / CIP 108128 / LMG 27833 / NCIMB 13906 / BL2) TaxID=395965 RepID=B8ESQ3_METSB|nr:heparinase II/III family protein [Methylocella silvestris]ACK50388.1 Heparinase II/III family protein [Methylocella silvestris BL2]
MAGAILKDRLHVAGLVLARGAAAAWRFAASPWRALAGLRRRPPERLLIAPQDIRTSDPTLAADIYAGYFAFGGKIVNAHGRSPFELEPQSDAWARSLASFSWLRHLRAADTAISKANARALVEDFLVDFSKPGANAAWEPRVAARRLLAFLSQSPIILHGADRAFYRRFMKAIGRTQQFLERKMAEGLAGEDRLLVAIALVELSLCAEDAGKLRQRAGRMLAEELQRQILPDGGHISRNPQILIDLLLDLLPLRQAYAARGAQPPPQLLNAIDRMMPMLRLFRHGDGALALFNGMGVTPPEQLATVLAYDDSRARALTNAPHSGYQRLEGQDAVVVVDAGRPPPPVFSTRAHAGCASFEFSVGAQRLVLNCGAPEANRAAAREAARMTAAHSTLVVDDLSSSRFAFHLGLRKWLGDEIVSGPEQVEIERRDEAAGSTLVVQHDGYASRFGLICQRRLVLHKDGKWLDGADRMVAATPGDAIERRPFAVRFHIHPNVRLKRVREGHAVLCLLPNGRRWLFETPWIAEIEESIFFAAPDGPRACSQIVLEGETRDGLELTWSFRQAEKKKR